MKITRWNNEQELSPSLLEGSLKKEGLSPFVWQDSPGTYYPTHTHSYSEIRWILKGSITFGVNGEEVTLYPGDCLELPANTPHYAKMANDSATVYLCASKEQ